MDKGLNWITDFTWGADEIKTGYVISVIRHFCKPQPLRTLAEIRADSKDPLQR